MGMYILFPKTNIFGQLRDTLDVRFYFVIHIRTEIHPLIRCKVN